MGASLYFTMTCFIWAALNGKKTPTFLPGRDSRKQKSPSAYVQYDKPEIVYYGETGLFDIKFGEDKFLKGCMPRLAMDGRTFTPLAKNKKNKMLVNDIDEEKPSTSELGKVVETTITWTLGDTGKQVIGKVLKGVDGPFFQFKLILPWGCQLPPQAQVQRARD
jgi:hypothetical protein